MTILFKWHLCCRTSKPNPLFFINREPEQRVKPQRGKRSTLLPAGEVSEVSVQRIGAAGPWGEAQRPLGQPDEPPQPRPLHPQPPQPIAPQPLALAPQPAVLHLQPRPLHPDRPGLLRPQRAEPRLLLRTPGPAPAVLSGPTSTPQDLGQQ